jgi:hypothetical protein
MEWDETLHGGFMRAGKPNKRGLFGTARYENRRPFPNFKTGALLGLAPGDALRRFSKSNFSQKMVLLISPIDRRRPGQSGRIEIVPTWTSP